MTCENNLFPKRIVWYHNTFRKANENLIFSRSSCANTSNTYSWPCIGSSSFSEKKNKTKLQHFHSCWKKAKHTLKILQFLQFYITKFLKCIWPFFQKIKSLIPIRPVYWKHFWAECWQLGFQSTFSIEICLEKNRWDLAFCVNDKIGRKDRKRNDFYSTWKLRCQCLT